VSRFVLVLIFTFALFVRVIGIGNYPIGFTADEAGIAYDSYSILSTGRDQWGERFPLVLRSFGDYKLPGYSYLAMPSIALFGLNEFAARLPNALFGVLAVIATYLMVFEFTKKRNFALLSSFFLAISPWHISLSRGAFEANLTTFFITFGIWGFLKGLKDKKFMWIALLSFGVNLFTYHSARVFTPIIALSLIVYYRKELFGESLDIKSFFEKYRGVIIGSIVLLVIVLSTFFMGAGKRGMDVSIFNPSDKWAAVSDRRYEAFLQGVPDQISRAFSNKVTYAFDRFTSNYLAYFSTFFLFTEGAGEWTYGMVPGRGVLYLFEVITLSLALIYYLKGKGFKGMGFLLFWVLLSPLPVALSKSIGHAANRAIVMVPAIQIISSYGLYAAYGWVSDNYKSLRGLFVSVFVILFTVFFAGFVEDYIYHAPMAGAQSMHFGVKEAISYVNDVEGDYDKIFISRSLSVPNIWVAFYNKWDPSEHQDASVDWKKYEEEGFLYIDQMSQWRLGKYVFGSIDFGDIQEEWKTLFIGRPDEFPENINIMKIVYYPNGNPAYYVVSGQPFK
jgi:hypothetical protein